MTIIDTVLESLADNIARLRVCVPPSYDSATERVAICNEVIAIASQYAKKDAAIGVFIKSLKNEIEVFTEKYIPAE